MTEQQEPEAKDYTKLPEPVRPEEWVTEIPSEDPHDPDGGRDPERDFMIRYAGG